MQWSVSFETFLGDDGKRCIAVLIAIQAEGFGNKPCTDLRMEDVSETVAIFERASRSFKDQMFDYVRG